MLYHCTNDFHSFCSLIFFICRDWRRFLNQLLLLWMSWKWLRAPSVVPSKNCPLLSSMLGPNRQWGPFLTYQFSIFLFEGWPLLNFVHVYGIDLFHRLCNQDGIHPFVGKSFIFSRQNSVHFLFFLVWRLVFWEIPVFPRTQKIFILAVGICLSLSW